MGSAEDGRRCAPGGGRDRNDSQQTLKATPLPAAREVARGRQDTDLAAGSDGWCSQDSVALLRGAAARWPPRL